MNAGLTRWLLDQYTTHTQTMLRRATAVLHEWDSSYEAVYDRRSGVHGRQVAPSVHMNERGVFHVDIVEPGMTQVYLVIYVDGKSLLFTDPRMVEVGDWIELDGRDIFFA